MTEREEILAQLIEVRKLVSALPAHLPFTVETSRFLDWLDSTIERMEGRE
jgi:hypothetical protein